MIWIQVMNLNSDYIERVLIESDRARSAWGQWMSDIIARACVGSEDQEDNGLSATDYSRVDPASTATDHDEQRGDHNLGDRVR